MAIIVEHKELKGKYILIGTGFGAYKTCRPAVFIANHLPREDLGEITMVAVCDEEGQIQWFNSEELIVLEVDKVSPHDVLSEK